MEVCCNIAHFEGKDWYSTRNAPFKLVSKACHLTLVGLVQLLLSLSDEHIYRWIIRLTYIVKQDHEHTSVKLKPKYKRSFASTTVVIS